VSVVGRKRCCVGVRRRMMRRKSSIYLPSGLEYLMCCNGVQSEMMSSIVLSLGEGRGCWSELCRGTEVFETVGIDFPLCHVQHLPRHSVLHSHNNNGLRSYLHVDEA
jgi:hypothetical protein